MKVLIIGCGAVGIGLAASLCAAGAETDLVARGATAESIRENGIERHGIFDEVKIPPERLRVWENASETPGGYDAILISAKTTGNSEIAGDLAACRADILAPGGLIVLFQNGFGNESCFTGDFDPRRIYTASFAIGFRRPERHVSEVTVFSKKILIGSLCGAPSDTPAGLAAAIAAGGIPCETSGDIGKVVWSKLLYNCTLNPLSALLGVNYGGLAVSEHTKAIMENIIEEIFAVMHAAGYETFWPDAETYKDKLFNEILPPTYSHPSSTLQDMQRKIPTEIDSLNGAVARLGRQYSIETPCNTMLVRLIKSAEALYHYKR